MISFFDFGFYYDSYRFDMGSDRAPHPNAPAPFYMFKM